VPERAGETGPLRSRRHTGTRKLHDNREHGMSRKEVSAGDW